MFHAVKSVKYDNFSIFYCVLHGVLYGVLHKILFHNSHVHTRFCLQKMLII